MPNIPTVAIVVLLIVIAILLVAALYAKNYVKVPPNKVAVFTGRGKTKVVKGGARFRMPVVERVDFMDLTPFDIRMEVDNARDLNGVGLSLSVVALVKFGSDEDLLNTAIERWLNADRVTLNNQLTEILAGNMRAICAKMTIEDINGNRDTLAHSVSEEAGAALHSIGMELDVLTIRDVSDHSHYLDALGRTRVAEVTRDAEIGEANAQRDSLIQSAQADQEGKTAKALADAAIADAERGLALKRAAIDTEVNAAKARAAQAGPQADAEAHKAVVLAEVAVELERTKAQIAVEQQRAERQQQALQADVIAPANAEREAAIARAAGTKAAAIAEAEADAKKQELEGNAAAGARTAASVALENELRAQAAGIGAKLKAEAEGQKELAAALALYTTEAARLNILPQLIAVMPEMAKAIAAQIGQIDKMVVVAGGNGSGEGGDIMSQLTSAIPLGLATVMETIRATTGVDIKSLTQSSDDKSSDVDSEVPTDQFAA